MDSANIKLTDNLRADADLTRLVESCGSLVAQEIALATANARWDVQPDEKGRDVLELHIWDQSGGEARTRFAPVELGNENQMRARLHDLKGAALIVCKWRQEIWELFKSLRGWIKNSPWIVDERTIEINEDRSGLYEVPMLRLMSNGNTVEAVPIGAWIVGANGRVDLKGDEGEAILILDRSDHWQGVGDSSHSRPQELTNELFLQLLDDIS